MKKFFYSFIATAAFVAMPAMAQDAQETVSDFENIPTVKFNPDGFYRGDSLDVNGKKVEGTPMPWDPKSLFWVCDYEQAPITYDLIFNHSVTKYGVFDSTTGIGVSKVSDNTYKYKTGDYANIVGGGYKSETFGVVMGKKVGFTIAKGSRIKGLYLTNNMRVVDIMKKGKYGGKGKLSKEGDFFKVIIQGAKFDKKGNDEEIDGATVEVMLGEFKNGAIQLLDTWKYIDLSSFPAEAQRIIFKFDGAKESYGDYTVIDEKCCIDNVTTVAVAAGIENVANNANAVEVARYNVNGARLNTPQRGVNIVKMSDGTTRKEIIK